MEKNLVKAGFTAVLLFLIAGCSGYNKLLKSRNHDLMYTKALEYYEAKKYQKSIQLLEEVARYSQGTNRDDSVAYFLATSYYRQGDFETSGMYFDDFRKTFTNSVFLEDAEYMYAKGFYYMSPPANRDQGATQAALIAIDEYINRYPNSVKREVMDENIRELTQKLHDKAYINAKSYYTTRQYKAAVMALRNAINQWPDSNHREEMMYLVTKSNYLLASKSIYSLQRDRYLDMMDNYYNFISEYPNSKYVRELEKMQEEAKDFIANFQDRDDLDPEELKELEAIF